MPKYKMTPEERTKRTKARQAIVKAANKHSRIADQYRDGRPYKMPELQRCVSIVKRRCLVKDATLIAAGFRPYGNAQVRAARSLGPVPQVKGVQALLDSFKTDA